MNQYIIFYNPVRATFLDDATPEELAVVERHAEYLEELLGEGRLLLAGRCQDGPPGIAVFEAEDDDAARHIAMTDPAVVEGVFRAEVRPYRVAMMRG